MSRKLFVISAFQLFSLSAFSSDRVHEGSFDTGEHNDADEQDSDRHRGAVAQVSPTEHSGTQEPVPERFDDRAHGVGANDQAVLPRETG